MAQGGLDVVQRTRCSGFSLDAFIAGR